MDFSLTFPAKLNKGYFIYLSEVKRNGHTHSKPIGLQGKLIEAVSHAGDIVIDPAAGSFSVMEACRQSSRNFLGCDING